jgi:predicted flap endonuclease-1-like 5' DNA nuclease
MEFNRETKNMIAIFALVLAITFGINYAVAPDVDQSFISWSMGLFVVAVLFWIWIRRDDLAANREEALKAAEDAAKRAEDLAAKAKDKAEAELDKGKGKIEILAEDVKSSTEQIAEALDETVEDVSEEAEDAVEEVTDEAEDVVETVAEEVEEATSDEPDDLSKVEGIGPVYQDILKDAGVTTFAAIASKSQAELEQIIKDAGKRRPASIETWAEQAEYAAKGDWDGLQKLQDSLDGGRRK